MEAPSCLALLGAYQADVALSRRNPHRLVQRHLHTTALCAAPKAEAGTASADRRGGQQPGCAVAAVCLVARIHRGHTDQLERYHRQNGAEG